MEQRYKSFPRFHGINTTCEYMAERFWEEVIEELGPLQTANHRRVSAFPPGESQRLGIRIVESDVASVEFVREVATPTRPDGNAGATLTNRPEDFVLDIPSVFLFDFDKVLFHDKSVQKKLVERIHAVCGARFGLSGEDCDRLHFQYGSTIEGVVREFPTKICQTNDDLLDLYDAIYCEKSCSPKPRLGEQSSSSSSGEDDMLQVSEFLFGNGPSELRGKEPRSATSSSGFDHDVSLARLLRGLPARKFIVSNSHSSYVRAALARAGLDERIFDGVITPERVLRRRGHENIKLSTSKCPPRPSSKTDPYFWPKVLAEISADPEECVFFDDCSKNLVSAAEFGIRGVRIIGEESGKNISEEENTTRFAHCPSLESAIMNEFLGTNKRASSSSGVVEYLSGLADLNRASLNEGLFLTLQEELRKRTTPTSTSFPQNKDPAPLTVFDVGCGVLPLLEKFAKLASDLGRRLVYIGLERDGRAREAAAQRLTTLGLVQRPDMHPIPLVLEQSSPIPHSNAFF